MKYCFLDIYGDHYNETYYNHKHTIVIVACDSIYNQVPLDGSIKWLVNSSSAPHGYGWGEFEEAVIDAFSDENFTPCGINNKEVVINSNLANNPLFEDLLLALGGSLNNVWTLDQNVRFSSGQGNTGIMCGALDMADWLYSEGCTFTGSVQKAPIGGSEGNMAAPSASSPYDSDHFIYEIDIMPEALIDSGVIVPGAMHNSVSDPSNPDQKHWCRLRVEAWQYIDGPDVGRYNFLAYIYGFDHSISVLEYLAGTERSLGNIYNTKKQDNDPTKKNTGGNNDNDNKTDNIPVPDLPTSDMTAAGVVRVYAPELQDLADLFNYLHSATIPDSIAKLWQNPIQGIVSLHYLPYPLRHKTQYNTKQSIDFLGLPTGGASAYVAEQFQTINFGYCEVGTNANDSYLDRSPYTKVQIYLPGIGIRELSADDVIGHTLWVQYNCDNVSGQCVAFIVVGGGGDEKSVKYSFSGSLAAPFPISQNNWGQTYVAAATLAAGALANGIGMASGALAAGAGTGGSAVGSALNVAGGVAKGAQNIGSSLTALAKPTITRSGTVSGTTSLFNVRTPYLIIERPRIASYSGAPRLKGYPCGMTFKLSEISGYTEVERIHLEGIPALSSELEEIERLLKGGVIL